MFWMRGLPKFQPQVLSRLATSECKQLQPWDSTTSTGRLGPHRADRWGWGGWAGLAGGLTYSMKAPLQEATAQLFP